MFATHSKLFMVVVVLFSLSNFPRPVATADPAETCNFVLLVKCFLQHIDDWAVSLWEHKNNPVTIDENDCEHWTKIRKCVKDEGTEKHNCEPKEVLETSKTVSDLLTHRKNGGTFLKSYFLLQYACEEGKTKVAANKKCLEKEYIGQQTLSAASYLEDKLHQFKNFTVRNGDRFQEEWHPMNVPARCDLLKKKLSLFRTAIPNDVCNGAAQSIMCQSLYIMFKNTIPEKLGDCPYDCDGDANGKPTEIPNIRASAAPVQGQQNGNAGGDNGTSTAAKISKLSLLNALLSLLLLWLGLF